MVGGPQADSGDPSKIIEGILALGQSIEQTLLSFAQAMPEGARFFQEANELIKQGIAAEMAASQNGGGAGAAAPAAPASSPTNVGPQFPGGGLGSGARP